MKKVIKYDVLRSDTADGLVDIVNRFLDLGWELYGSGYSREPYYVQPMVKYLEETKDK